MPVVAGPVLAKLPVVEVLDLSAFPPAPPHVVDSQLNSAACWHWEKVAGESMATTSVIAGPTIPVADSQVDKVVELVKSPRAAACRPTGCSWGPITPITWCQRGIRHRRRPMESLWWISESGVRFGVPREEDTLRALGLKKAHAPSPAPWLALRLLAPGPALSRADALVRHNTLPVDANPGELEVPKS